MNKPLVSVIMPVYNGEKYIRKAVESVYEQEVSLELLVIDDGSTDHTEEVLSAYEGREDFRYIKNEQNMGAAGSRNRGVGLAQGTYIAFLDADDWWESGKLKEQLKRLEETGLLLCEHTTPFCQILQMTGRQKNAQQCNGQLTAKSYLLQQA